MPALSKCKILNKENENETGNCSQLASQIYKKTS